MASGCDLCTYDDDGMITLFCIEHNPLVRMRDSDHALTILPGPVPKEERGPRAPNYQWNASDMQSALRARKHHRPTFVCSVTGEMIADTLPPSFASLAKRYNVPKSTLCDKVRVPLPTSLSMN